MFVHLHTAISIFFFCNSIFLVKSQLVWGYIHLYICMFICMYLLPSMKFIQYVFTLLLYLYINMYHMSMCLFIQMYNFSYNFKRVVGPPICRCILQYKRYICMGVCLERTCISMFFNIARFNLVYASGLTIQKHRTQNKKLKTQDMSTFPFGMNAGRYKYIHMKSKRK